MRAKEAVAARLLELCAEHDMTVNELANEAGMSPSTIYSILNTKSMNPGIITLKQICDGMNITLRGFFDSPLFDDLEQEIK